MKRKQKLTLHPFILLSIGTFAMFVVLGIGGMMQARMTDGPIASIQGTAASLSGKFFADMLAMEIPRMTDATGEESSFSSDKMFSAAFQMMTNINPHDPKTLLAGGVPGLASEKIVNLRSAVGNPDYQQPADYAPSKDAVADNGEQDGADAPSHTDDYNAELFPLDAAKQQENSDKTGSGSSGENGEKQPSSSLSQTVKAFIYHSHNRESFLPELEGKTALNDAFDAKVNVTLLGQRMAERLNEEGVGAVHSTEDYALLPNYNWNYSYKYSLKTVKEAFASYPDMNYLFDIHRDSAARDATTITINGKDYAQIYFIIGRRNPHWEKNEAFANHIHKQLEEAYPGLSRGIWGKTASSGNAEYNQTQSNNAILIEVGGPENTLEECNRTIDVLSDVIAAQIMNAEKVNADAQKEKQAS